MPLAASRLPRRRPRTAVEDGALAVDRREPRVTGAVASALGRVLRTRGLGPRATAVDIATTTSVVVANAAAGLVVLVYLTITENVADDDAATWAGVIGGNVGFYCVCIGLLSIATIARGRKVFARSWRFLDTGEPITDDDRRRLVQLPARMGFFPVRYWMVVAVAAMAYRAWYDEGIDAVLLVGVTVMVGALMAGTLGFLLGERTLRPTFAVALEGRAPPEQPSLGLGTRLVLAWALGSGLPLALLGATPFLAVDADLGVRWAVVTLSVLSFIVGFVIMVGAARAVSRPLGRVRDALRLVGEGDLETGVVVDDGAEIGRLQAGVNEMVEGLRERERIEELFGRHVGTAVARRAVEEGATLGGQVRCVTILFVDIKGSSELARRHPPEEVVALLNRFFAAVVAACDAEEGWLDKFEGDGALCVFGAPVDQPDHADRALRAARRLAGALARMRARQPDLDAGIGVATGDVVVGHVGTESRLEYTVIGDPVNTAARLTVEAKHRASRLLASAAAVGAATPAEAASWRPGGAVELRGIAGALEAWEPVEAG